MTLAAVLVFQKTKADVQAAEDALFSSEFKDTETGYRKYLDVDSFIDWYFVNEITKNPDAQFYSSVYMYYDPVKGEGAAYAGEVGYVKNFLTQRIAWLDVNL
ncbi:hypothetical protein AGMMS50267_17270 [Spirochaetia bacterium]|nr:hypothetical protein AGMMS50267_17270 [Spirochaetia bacterium]